MALRPFRALALLLAPMLPILACTSAAPPEPVTPRPAGSSAAGVPPLLAVEEESPTPAPSEIATDSPAAEPSATDPSATEPPATDPPATDLPASSITAEQETVTLIGAGDIGVCGTGNDNLTGDIIKDRPGTVFLAGDNVYEAGTYEEYMACYDPVWGEFKDRTYPVPGNHEWMTPGAEGYFRYFGERAGSPTKDWYAIELGAWDILFLDSACVRVGGCGEASPQGTWLEGYVSGLDPERCLMAIWHHPRWASEGNHGDDDRTDHWWETLHEAGAEVVVSGHEHFYEVFEPLGPTGLPDPQTGIREFIVGTGGRVLTDIHTVRASSAVRETDTHGVIEFTLRADSYDWQFIPVEGKTFTDEGSGDCHGAPAETP